MISVSSSSRILEVCITEQKLDIKMVSNVI